MAFGHSVLPGQLAGKQLGFPFIAPDDLFCLSLLVVNIMALKFLSILRTASFAYFDTIFYSYLAVLCGHFVSMQH